MSSNKALLLLTLTASASAAINYMAIPQVRDLLPAPTPVAHNLKPRPRRRRRRRSLPTPPPALLSDLSKSAQQEQTDPCKLSFPASLSDDVSSYSSKVLSWYSGHEAELTSLAKQCSAAQSYTGLVNVCTDDDSSGSGSAASKTADATTKTAGAGAATSTNVGAAHETGMAFAALAAAGIAAIL
ncbi:SSCRP protein [Trichoderma parareesei]|uniref:SSCRP protein n=1 Tax=Trichoderma parareesei TaxID=858221 RepID=A0A2H2YYX5_TRIPA|nr:SSCRP protein [Trichoderma parareesei]